MSTNEIARGFDGGLHGYDAPATKPKAERIRTGDRVKITTPKRFVRCGYPLAMDEARRIVEERFGPQIQNLLEDIRGQDFHVSRGLFVPTIPDRNYLQLIDRAAYAYLCAKGHGGNQRTIHTEERPELLGAEFRVEVIRYVITGKRVPGSPGSWECPDDVDPPYLGYQKRHAILQTYYVLLPDHNPAQLGELTTFEIETANCEKVVVL